MAPQLTLHIGTPKSGTTYLQTILRSGRKDLRRRGICFPGKDYLPHGGLNQQPAIYALGRRNIGWVGQEARENAVRYFDRLCEEISAHSGRTLISAESLSFFDRTEIETLLADLRADPAEVDVIITARDFGRLLPSIWQQNVKNGSSQPLEEYLSSLSALRGIPGVPLWTAFGLPGLVSRWSDVVDPRRITLVTVPHRGRGELWPRFATAAGVPEPLAENAVKDRSERNLSLTLSQTDLLRHLNQCLDDGRRSAEKQRLVRRKILDSWMRAESRTGSPILLPERFRSLIERWADEDVQELRSLGVSVVGSLEDLRPASEQVTSPGAVAGTSLEQLAADLLLLLESPATAVPAIRRATVGLQLVRSLRRRLRGPAPAATAAVPAAAPPPLAPADSAATVEA